MVDIDEQSLARYGQWPWPRTLVAELVRRIARARPRVLGIDIVFAEPDRLSPPEIARELTGLPGPLAEELANLPASERDLAEAIADRSCGARPGARAGGEGRCPGNAASCADPSGRRRPETSSEGLQIAARQPAGDRCGGARGWRQRGASLTTTASFGALPSP